MPEELIMRGKTDSGTTETLNFGGRTPGYGYHLTEFQLWGSESIGTNKVEAVGAITADDSAMDPVNPDFDSPGLIGVCNFADNESDAYGPQVASIINDLFVITQDLILMVTDTGGVANPINWQVRFKKVKLSSSAEAVANFNQFTIYDN